MAEQFVDELPGEPSVKGFLHRAEGSNADGLVLTHGAGSSSNSPLLVALAESLSARGVTVLRCDLPFRQSRPHGPPLGSAEKDQAGLRRAVQVLRNIVSGRVFLGGHSYGGRMASVLAAQDSSLTDGLLLLSYPLHPPRRPQQLRTAHLPKLRTSALFVHGTRDPFGSIEEMQAALASVPSKTKLVAAEGMGHELILKKNPAESAQIITGEFLAFNRR